MFKTAIAPSVVIKQGTIVEPINFELAEKQLSEISKQNESIKQKEEGEDLELVSPPPPKNKSKKRSRKSKGIKVT